MANRQYPVPFETGGGGGGSGTVASVGLVDSTGTFTVTGSPVTTSGNIALSAFANQAANSFLAGPSSGAASAAAFRKMAAADESNRVGINAANSGVTGNGYFLFGGTGAPVASGPLVYYLTLTQVAVSGGTTTYTGTIAPSSSISNIVETAGNRVTLTVGVNNQWQPGQKVQLSGLTTGTWLNGQTVTLLAGTTNVSLVFTDPTAHGTQASHADTGTATINFANYTFTVTGFTNSGNNVQITVTSNTATTLVCTTSTQVNETHAANAGSNTVDCSGGLFNTHATVGQVVFATTLSTGGFTTLSVTVIPQGTITAINSDTQIVVSAAPTLVAANVCLVWGDDETTALQNAWALVTASNTGAMLVLPASNPLGDGPAVILTTKAQLNTSGSVNPGTGGARAGWGAYGGGKNATYIVPTPNFDFTTTTGNVCFLNVNDGGYFHDFTIWGAGVSNPASGLSTKIGARLGSADNGCWHDLALMAWGANATNGIGVGYQVGSGGVNILQNIDCDMFGQVGCSVLDGYHFFNQCGFWDNGTGNLLINNSGTTAVHTVQCYFGNSGYGIGVNGGAQWRDFGSQVSLNLNGSGYSTDAITVGGVPTTGGTGTIWLTGTIVDTQLSAGGHCIRLDNVNCKAFLTNCRIADRSTQVCLRAIGGTIVDAGGNTFTSAGTVFSTASGGVILRTTAGTATVNSTALGANVGTTTAYAVPTGFDGLYKVSTYIDITTADLVSSTMPSVVVGWTDDSSTAQSSTVSATNTANTVGTFAASDTVVYAKGGTNITYSTASYASNTAAAMKYSLRVRVEWLG